MTETDLKELGFNKVLISEDAKKGISFLAGKLNTINFKGK